MRRLTPYLSEDLTSNRAPLAPRSYERLAPLCMEILPPHVMNSVGPESGGDSGGCASVARRPVGRLSADQLQSVAIATRSARLCDMLLQTAFPAPLAEERTLRGSPGRVCPDCALPEHSVPLTPLAANARIYDLMLRSMIERSCSCSVQAQEGSVGALLLRLRSSML